MKPLPIASVFPAPGVTIAGGVGARFSNVHTLWMVYRNAGC